MFNGDAQYRVYNRCNYDIGVPLAAGQRRNIRAGAFIPMTANDVLYIESVARGRKPFSSGELEVVGPDGKGLTLEEIGGYTDTYTEKHYGKEEIMANLKKSAKQIETWLSGIDDPVELHAISEVATEMDLQGSKLKLIQAKVPNIDLLGPEE